MLNAPSAVRFPFSTGYWQSLTSIQSSSTENAKKTEDGDEANSDGEDEDEDGDEDEDELPTMTPSLIEFSKIPYKGFEQSYEFLKRDRSVLATAATDALLLQAFNAESDGDKKYAKQCVHQGLMIQYCEKLGRDGVALFFKRYVIVEHENVHSLMWNLFQHGLW